MQCGTGGPGVFVPDRAQGGRHRPPLQVRYVMSDARTGRPTVVPGRNWRFAEVGALRHSESRIWRRRYETRLTCADGLLEDLTAGRLITLELRRRVSSCPCLTDVPGPGTHIGQVVVTGAANPARLIRTYVILILPKCLLTWGYVKVDPAAFLSTARGTGTAHPPGRWRFDL